MDNTQTSRGFRSLVISLAVVLTIIDLTLGFTLRNQDLYAEESSKLLVQHDVKRSNDFKKTDNAETSSIVPLKAEENRTIAVNASVIITYPKDVTERLIDKSSTEVTDPTPVTNASSMYVNPSNVTRLDWSEVKPNTTVTEAAKSENQTETRYVASNMKNITNNNNKTIEQSVQIENFASTLDPLKTTNANNLSSVAEDTSTLATTTDTYASVTSLIANEQSMSSKLTEAATSQIDLPSDVLSSTEVIMEDSATPNNRVVGLPWKQYSNITRKRIANVTDFRNTAAKRISDSINSHTTESRVTLEQAFNLSPDTLSLQNLKNNLKETTKMTQAQGNIESTITAENPNPMVSSTDGQSINKDVSSSTASSRGNQIEMVSKRAGYLNHTKTMAEAQNTSRITEPESDTLAYEIDLLENDRVEKKTSQSQLADDAIKEELLKESIRMDDAVNNFMHKTVTSHKQVESISNLQVAEQKVEDELSVKPISPDTAQKKNTILYTVNPNYKPLKKLEIQPPKPFTRDPDDNSWRNESLTSLGIVFNAKNSSKAFTEVLKNKTETVMNNLPDQNRTIEKVELRERLEKIAEKRKSKKKKTDQFGNIEYTDYEENNSGNDSRSSKEMPMDIIPLSPQLPPQVLETTADIYSTTSFVTNPYTNTVASTPPGSRYLSPEYYESSEDDDYQYMPKIDIKKTTTTTPRMRPMPVTPVILDAAVPEKSFPERKPTVQYFPPRSRQPEVNYNEYNDRLGKKINIYNVNAPPPPPQIYTTTQKTEIPTEHETYSTKVEFRNEQNFDNGPKGSRNRVPIVDHVEYRPVDNVYLTQPPKLGPGNSYDNQDNIKGGFIIRHYKDFLDKAIRDSDYDRNAYLYTEGPITGVTANDVEKVTVKSGEYNYEQRKELLDRFVNNFNQNHEQFKVDFPVLFNTSIVHKQGPDSGKVLASSSAMFKRLYNDDTASRVNGFLYNTKAYDPNCENITVELSPAYELHYYVPDQEEREEQAKLNSPHLF